MSKQTGQEPAFPCPQFIGEHTEHGECWGMSLRDYFAGICIPFAWQLQLMNIQQLEATGMLKGISEEEGQKASRAGVAEMAYDMADAMLEKRAEKLTPDAAAPGAL